MSGFVCGGVAVETGFKIFEHADAFRGSSLFSFASRGPRDGRQPTSGRASAAGPLFARTGACFSAAPAVLGCRTLAQLPKEGGKPSHVPLKQLFGHFREDSGVGFRSSPCACVPPAHSPVWSPSPTSVRSPRPWCGSRPRRPARSFRGGGVLLKCGVSIAALAGAASRGGGGACVPLPRGPEGVPSEAGVSSGASLHCWGDGDGVIQRSVGGAVRWLAPPVRANLAFLVSTPWVRRAGGAGVPSVPLAWSRAVLLRGPSPRDALARCPCFWVGAGLARRVLRAPCLGGSEPGAPSLPHMLGGATRGAVWAWSFLFRGFPRSSSWSANTGRLGAGPPALLPLASPSSARLRCPRALRGALRSGAPVGVSCPPPPPPRVTEFHECRLNAHRVQGAGAARRGAPEATPAIPSLRFLLPSPAGHRSCYVVLASPFSVW